MSENQCIQKTSRAFNKVLINPKNCTVVKQSTNQKKLKAEYFWYENLPQSLQGYVPKAIDFEYGAEVATLTMDYYPCPNLSELFTIDSTLDWKVILTRLLEVFDDFRACSAPEAAFSFVCGFYTSKTTSRIYSLMQSEYWKSLINQKEFRINGTIYKNLDLDQLLAWQSERFTSIKPSVVHGDYCFSNILFDKKTGCVKLIDPRGYLGNDESPTIYGDPEYDIAKLMHSFHGGYDFIVQNKYTLLQLDNEYGFRLHAPSSYSDLIHWFIPEDDLIHRVLEILLFVTMIPLHYEDSKRQLAFYLRAVQLYNELLDLRI